MRELELLRMLATVPINDRSKGSARIFDLVTAETSGTGLVVRRMEANKKPSALILELISDRPGPTLLLNAPADTAPVGARSSWENDPFGAVEKEGWLFGRGVADSRCAIAVFTRLMVELASEGLPSGRLIAAFDADEHTGLFGGMKQFLDSEVGTIDGAMIGYPGNDHVRDGARGFWRATIRFTSVLAHSGSREVVPTSIEDASRFVTMLHEASDHLPVDEYLGLSPKATATKIRGGSGFSVTPDSASVDIDVRTTTSWTSDDAEALVSLVAHESSSSEYPPRIRTHSTYPAYKLELGHPLTKALVQGASDAFKKPVTPLSAGPSNIGNLLALHGIPATCGFGPTAQGVHGPNEAIAVDSISPMLDAYRSAVLTYLR